MLFSQRSSVISFLNLIRLQILAKDLRGHFKAYFEITLHADLGNFRSFRSVCCLKREGQD